LFGGACQGIIEVYEYLFEILIKVYFSFFRILTGFSRATWEFEGGFGRIARNLYLYFAKIGFGNE